MAANELLEEVVEYEDDVLDDAERDLESTIKVSADSMEIDFFRLLVLIFFPWM